MAWSNFILNEKLKEDEISYFIKYKGKAAKAVDLNAVQLEIFRDPEAFRRRLLSCLKKYYYLFFEKELRFIEPLLIRIMKRQIELSKRIGIFEYIKTIHPRIKLENGEIKLIKYTVYNFTYDKLKRFDFRISSFVAPHLLVGIQEKNFLQFTISANLEERVEQVPIDLSKIMKAFGISEAAVSKHLKLMPDSGMLHKERRGNYIHYVLDKMALDSIPMKLYEYLAD